MRSPGGLVVDDAELVVLVEDEGVELGGGHERGAREARGRRLLSLRARDREGGHPGTEVAVVGDPDGGGGEVAAQGRVGGYGTRVRGCWRGRRPRCPTCCADQSEFGEAVLTAWL